MILDKIKKSTKKNIIGNKSSNLIWLEKNNIPVPRFEIILLDNYIYNFETVKESIVKKFKLNDQIGIDQLFDKIYIDEGKLKKDYLALKLFSNKLVSFRTSASLEDLEDYSFAGLYETYLNIHFTKKNFKIYLKKCFRSIFSDRVFKYIQSNKIEIDNVNFSIIVQEMYEAKFSGVAFSQYPLNIKIVFNKGPGEKIVDGSNAYEFELTKIKQLKNLSIIRKLDLEILFKKLISNIQKITYLKEFGQDIEWSMGEKNVAILQTRNITKNLNTETQEEILDSTNISESYPSVISPLTYSFIQFAYSKVYVNFFQLIGVKDFKITEKQDALNNLLGFIEGRVYYKISNWYKMLEILPGYKYNKEFFESMLVPQKKITPNVISKKTSSRIITLIKNIPLIIKFGYKLIFHKKLNNAFLKNFEKKYLYHKRTNLSKMNTREICTHYTQLKERFLSDWRVPILNDFRLMIFHGILKKIVFLNVKNNPQSYLNKLLGNFSQYQDLEIIHELNNLSQSISKKNELCELFKGSDSRIIYSQLLGSSSKIIIEFKNNLDKYIEKFGDRRPDELILESPRISDDPKLLIDLMKHYLKSNSINKKKPIQRKNIDIGSLIIKNHGIILGSPYKWITQWIIHYTKLSIKFRELFRIKRAVVYGIARDCFLILGEKFITAGIIDKKNDIFYLTTQEILSISNSNSFESDYKKVIADRKSIFIKYSRNNTLPQRIKIVGIGKNAQLIDDSGVSVVKDELRGLPTSHGIVIGRAVVLKKFDPTADISDKIIITYQTDPGWSIIFPLIKGIVLEKGNSLSHAAILSRELGIPSVVRVSGIVGKIRNGDLIEVDGNNGIIKIIEE